MVRLAWVKLPSGWINSRGLCAFHWGRGGGADQTAALMALLVIAHHADQETGVAKLTYDYICNVTSLSRSKLSKGLDILYGRRIIIREYAGRSTYLLVDYDPNQGWAMLPAKSLYSNGRISAFDNFYLRQPAEMNALKLYLLFVARRSREENMAHISFDGIEEYTGMERFRIKAATSLLSSLMLAYTERVRLAESRFGVSNAYRLTGLETYNHRGTRGNSDLTSIFD